MSRSHRMRYAEAKHNRVRTRDVGRRALSVVASACEPSPKIVRPVPGGEEDHRYIEPISTYPQTYLETIHVWQIDVQHDQIRRRSFDGPQRIKPGQLAPSPISNETKHRGQHIDQRLLVIDNEDAGRLSVRDTIFRVSIR